MGTLAFLCHGMGPTPRSPGAGTLATALVMHFDVTAPRDFSKRGDGDGDSSEFGREELH